MQDQQDDRVGQLKGKELDRAQKEQQKTMSRSSDLTDSETKGGAGASGEAGRTGGVSEKANPQSATNR